MASIANTVPIVMCGRSPIIGKPMSQLLKPDYEVIHFIQSFEDAVAELPLVLAAKDPQAQVKNDVGTGNFSDPPRAVLVGRGFSPDEVRELQKRSAGNSPVPVAWMAGNVPAIQAGASPPAGPEYVQQLAQDVKKLLGAWLETSPTEDTFIIY